MTILFFMASLLLELNHCPLVQEKTVGSVAPVNGQKRVKLCARKGSKDKRVLKRKSLAGLYFPFISYSHSLILKNYVCCQVIYSHSVFPDAGTSWESGVRRSTRFRTKPLEFWKGERMVYGRVHESEYNHITLLYI